MSTIRDATATDGEALAELLGQLGYPTTAAEVATRMEHWQAVRGRILLAQTDHIVGLAAVQIFPLLERNEQRARVLAFVVSEVDRGAGIGRRLLEAVETYAKSQGCLDIEITSSRTRAAAQRFYASHGYFDVSPRSARLIKALP